MKLGGKCLRKVAALASKGVGLGTVVVRSLSRVQLFATPWTAAHLSSLSFTISQSLLEGIVGQQEGSQEENWTHGMEKLGQARTYEDSWKPQRQTSDHITHTI